MFPVDQISLVAAVLLLVGIASSKVSSRIGLPVLVLFIAVGMLAGEEGLGGIEFGNYELAHGIATIALAIILYHGGLRTSRRSLRVVLGPAMVLATLGVVITAAITGIAAAWLLDVSLLEGLLIGSIVGSTDAAAVFAILRAKGVHLLRRLAATLEVESGSNDPMAIFLTVGILETMRGDMAIGPDMLWFLFRQVTIGIAAGLIVGRVAVSAINRVDLDAAGLYPILTGAAGLLAYGLAASLGGSGFLSVYLAGIVIGNRRIVFQRGILLFHDGAAWLAQIALFVLLGLLSSPSQVLDVAGEGLLIAAVLIFVARPVAVALLLPWFRYNFRELVFVSWVGLKGAVPIVLATYPLLLGIDGAEFFFNIIFFAVLVSAVLQGWTMPPFARWLGLQGEPTPTPPLSLEITSLRHVDGDIVEYTVTADSLAVNRFIRDLRLPDGAVIAMIARGDTIIPPRGSTRIEDGDHVFLVLRPGLRALVDRIFRRAREPRPIPQHVEFPLRADTTVADLREFYGIDIDAPPECTLRDLLENRLGTGLRAGSTLDLGTVDLVARTFQDGIVDRVGLVIRRPVR